MRFLVDAQLPRRLVLQLNAAGHEAVHTLDLPEGNRTSDRTICRHADTRGAAVITKDSDFVISRTLHSSPHRLLVIATGNISNAVLIRIIAANLPAIVQALANPAHVELSRVSLTVHD